MTIIKHISYQECPIFLESKCVRKWMRLYCPIYMRLHVLRKWTTFIQHRPTQNALSSVSLNVLRKQTTLICQQYQECPIFLESTCALVADDRYITHNLPRIPWYPRVYMCSRSSCTLPVTRYLGLPWPSTFSFFTIWPWPCVTFICRYIYTKIAK